MAVRKHRFRRLHFSGTADVEEYPVTANTRRVRPRTPQTRVSRRPCVAQPRLRARSR